MSELITKKSLNIAVLGNSHVGSLKFGWDLIKQHHPNLNITFFAAGVNVMRHLNVRNHLLVPTTRKLRTAIKLMSGGYRHIDLAKFDVCLIVGLNLAFPYRLEKSRTTHHFSTAAYQCAIDDMLASTLAMKTLSKVRCVSKLPVYVLHVPLKARTQNSFVDYKTDYAEFIAKINQRLTDHQAILLAQPEETIVDNFYTKPQYQSGAVHVDMGDKLANTPFPDGDVIHMNGEFGRIYLERIIQQLAAQPH